jgi:hypothetical protein
MSIIHGGMAKCRAENQDCGSKQREALASKSGGKMHGDSGGV